MAGGGEEGFSLQASQNVFSFHVFTQSQHTQPLLLTQCCDFFPVLPKLERIGSTSQQPEAFVYPFGYFFTPLEKIETAAHQH